MTTPLSTHIPQMSGAISTVGSGGTLIVDTGLRDLQTLDCSLAQDSAANAASASWELVTQVAGTTRKVTLKTWKGDGSTAGSVAAKVSWIALGK